MNKSREALEIKVVNDNPQTRYVLQFLFTSIGFPFRIVKQWHNPLLKILCAGSPLERGLPEEEKCDLILPGKTASNRAFAVSYFDGLPLLHGKNTPSPKAFLDGKMVGLPLIDTCFNLLTRSEEEMNNKQSDGEIRFEVYESDLYDLGLSQIPLLNLYICRLRQFITDRLNEKKKEIKSYPLWKNGKKFAISLTHDIDRICYASFKETYNRLRFAFDKKLLPRRRLEALITSGSQFLKTVKRVGKTEDPYWNFEKWLTAEKEFGFRSTFFVITLTEKGAIQDPAYRLHERVKFQGKIIPVYQMLYIMHKEGWEIGLHGSVASFRDPVRMMAEKKELESFCEISVTGIRQHYLMFKAQETWNFHEKCGFQYDSTLGSNRKIGYRAGVGLPFHPFDAKQNRELNLVELPLVIQDGAVMDEEPSSVEHTIERCTRIFETAKECGALVVLLWHPNTAFELAYPGWFTVYKTLLEWLSTQDVFVGTGQEICEWWKEREDQIFLGIEE